MMTFKMIIMKTTTAVQVTKINSFNGSKVPSFTLVTATLTRLKILTGENPTI